MRRFVLVTSRHNRYYDRFSKQFQRKNLEYACYYFEDFDYDKDQKPRYDGKLFSGFYTEDVVHMRDGGYEYSDDLNDRIRKIADLAENSGAMILDSDVWRYCPRLSDKYTQANMFSEWGIPHVETVLMSRFNKSWQDYPIIVKPRVGSGGKGNKILENYEELQKFTKNVKSEDYICQPFREVVRDLRVMWVNGEIIGVVNRKVTCHADNHVGVKVVEKVQLSEKEKKVMEKFSKVEGIFVRGVDLLTDSSGYIWVGEINVAPIFDGFERITGVDVVEKIVEAMVGRGEGKND